MGDAILHAGADKSQMGIAIARFDDLLFFRQLGPQIDLVVTVFGALREQGAKRMEEPGQQVPIVVHPERETAVEIACRRVEGNRKGPAGAVAADRLPGRYEQ